MMKKITFISLLLIATSSFASDDGIIEIIDFVDSPDPCLFYKDGLCVLTEEQAAENMEATSNDKSICLASYKDKCILNKEQAKKNYDKVAKNNKFKKNRFAERFNSPSNTIGGYRSSSRTADLRADAMLRR